MSDRITVTVAPGRSIPLNPHPSGLDGLPTLYLHAGQAMTVSSEEAEALFERGVIIHPVSGQAKVVRSADRQVTISIEGSVNIPLSDPSAAFELMKAERRLRDEKEALVVPPTYSPPPRTTVTVTVDEATPPEGVSIISYDV